MYYIKQLDSIRAIAVILVIISHWFPYNSRLLLYSSVFNGVDAFFVLSGFLITKILLENRNDAERLRTDKLSILKSFFIRRSLRIFPIYYITIVILYVLGPATGTAIRENFAYFLTYTSNHYFYNRQEWDGILSHLWSLSVEEQFYLVWPWLMLFLERRYLLFVILTSIFVGILGQLYLEDGIILTITCFDALGIGALIAWIVVYKPALLNSSYKFWSILAILALGIQLLRVSTPIGGEYISSNLSRRTLTAVFTAWVIIGILRHADKKSLFFDYILGNSFLIFIGKLSYGIYLFHHILPYFFSSYFIQMNEYLPPYFYEYKFYILQVENFTFVVTIAFLSWKIIEMPFLKFKKYFRYQKKPLTPSFSKG
ncbi:acyltransferase family protein [Pontibacter roseus]|uniref:acyltransferase family protein n=1 Tax=Pontibacter roseus TaxID=336989 RepID=UPI000363BC15|nr:acyltransferase [Pontibacter roseus]